MALTPSAFAATDVSVIGLFPGKAVLQVNGGKPCTLRPGEATPEGVKLIRLEDESAVVEIDGTRRILVMGQSISMATADSGRAMAALSADSRGHFVTAGTINGQTVQFLVDTGASLISMNATEARRIGVNYLKGERGYAATANGTAPVFKVRLDTVRVGNITLTSIDGLVHEGNNLPIVLLGMSFLNRVEMRREGSTMTLIRRY